MSRLSGAQRTALRHVERLIADRSETARAEIAAILHRAGDDLDNYREAMERVREHARVVIHFHPDRISRGARTVAAGLLAEGLYRNQFETGVSAGSMSTHAGGARDQWEKTLFGGAYHADGTSVAERPKYGALELVRHSDGPIPRFGSCYLVLKQEVSRRTSFTFMGSEQPLAPERLGIIGQMECVMAALLSEVAEGGMATPPWPPYRTPTLGVPDLTVVELLRLLRQELSGAGTESVRRSPGRVLDTVVEAHVHGDLDLRADVESLVVDRAFESTDTGYHLRQIADRYPLSLQWHNGPQLDANDVPDDFRGPDMPRIATRVARDGRVDAAAIGEAAAALREDPQSWAQFGDPARVSQLLKQLWHVVVHFGARATGAGSIG